MNYLKTPVFRSDKWLRAVASLDCVICGREGTQAAHRNQGKGMGLKTDDCLTAALCPECHSRIDQGADMTREERRRDMDAAILMTLRDLARQGLVRIA
jgi:uncharacterized protein YlaI